MHGQQPATRRSRKTLNAFFSKQCSQNGGTCISKSYYPIRLKLFYFEEYTSGWGGNQKKLQKIENLMKNFPKALKGRKI